MPDLAFSLHGSVIEKDFVRKQLFKDDSYPTIVYFLFFFNIGSHPKDIFGLIISKFLSVERWDAVGVYL